LHLAWIFISIFVLAAKVSAFEPHIAKYSLSINGISIAEEVRTLHKIDGGYFYTANAKTSGLVGLIKNYSISAKSSFNLNANGVDSSGYQVIEQDNNNVVKNFVVDINSKLNTVVSEPTKTKSNVKKWTTNGSNINDPLSLFLAISFDLKNKPKEKNLYYQVADGKSLDIYQCSVMSNQLIDINNKPTNVIRVDISEKSGDKIEVYYLSKYMYLPVLIKKDKGDEKYEYKIKDYKISEVQKLQVTF